ncbi:MAG: Hsp20/alpha crystallin family protein [Patescibacteria group bacterium]
MRKQSFFQRLTGAINTDDEYMFEDDVQTSRRGQSHVTQLAEEKELDAELAIDMIQTPSEVIIRTMVAGVNPEELEVSISQEMVVLKGSRRQVYETEEKDFFHKELYWGSFSRTILLPVEVRSEEAIAELKHGLLTIRLPKIDKQRQTRLRIKTI